MPSEQTMQPYTRPALRCSSNKDEHSLVSLKGTVVRTRFATGL